MTKVRLALVLAAFLPSAVRAANPPEVTVAESLPAGLAVDGDLKEWTAKPSATLGPANQTAGPVKLALPADFSATVWVAISKEGLAVAGKVTDDKVRFPEGANVVNADHAELWVALPAAPMPPLAFANQFGEIEVPDLESCETLEDIEDPDACRVWVKEQRRRRQSLEKLFVRQYLFTPAGVAESWSTTGKDDKAPEPPQKSCCAASKAVVKAAPGGWVFEAKIAADDFPATGQVPLADLALLVDLVDADDQVEKLESFVSTSARRKLGRTTTFNTVTLREPLKWETDPPLLASFAKGHDVFYFPGKAVSGAFSFDNVPVGYQYAPQQPSPVVKEMTVASTPVTKLGDISVYWTESPHGHTLYSLRGGNVLDGLSLDGELVANVKRSGTDTHQFLIKSEGTVSALGTGACGACPLHSVTVISLEKSGTFKKLLDEEVAESVPVDDAGTMLEDVKLEHEKEFVRVGFTAAKLDAEGESKGKWSQHWQWDSKKGTYVPAK